MNKASHSLRSPSRLPVAAVCPFKHASQLLLPTFLAGGDFLLVWHLAPVNGGPLRVSAQKVEIVSIRLKDHS